MSTNQLQKTGDAAAPKFESWVVFDTACQCLTVRSVQSIFGKSYRLVRAWATDPRTSEFVARNPLDRGRDFMAELVKAGKIDIAWASLNYMAEPLKARLTSKKPAKSTSGDPEKEQADILDIGGYFVRRLREARLDGVVDTREAIELYGLAQQLLREAEEAIDAAENAG